MMKKIYSPRNETELAFLRALLDGEQIPYFIHNDKFGSLNVGPAIPLFNAKSIMVPPDHAEKASRIISEYIDLTPETSSSWRQRLRNLLEFFLFGWFIPSGRGREKNSDRDHPPDAT